MGWYSNTGAQENEESNMLIVYAVTLSVKPYWFIAPTYLDILPLFVHVQYLPSFGIILPNKSLAEWVAMRLARLVGFKTR